MGDYPLLSAPKAAVPARLFEIPEPPKDLTYRGTLPPGDLPLLTVVGARQYSTYGKQVVSYLIEGLRGYRVGIVSGLALGIDALAHEAALRANLYTLAIPGSGLGDRVLYPRTNYQLARRILDAGGGLLSEFPESFKATQWSFIARNRLMAGIAHATLVIEASERSGTLVTARMCADYNRELFVVPGSIFTELARGPHLFLRYGATPVTTPQDLIEALGLTQVTQTEHTSASALDSISTHILSALREPLDMNHIATALSLNINEVGAALMLLELEGLVAQDQGIYRRLI